MRIQREAEFTLGNVAPVSALRTQNRPSSRREGATPTLQQPPVKASRKEPRPYPRPPQPRGTPPPRGRAGAVQRGSARGAPPSPSFPPACSPAGRPQWCWAAGPGGSAVSGSAAPPSSCRHEGATQRVRSGGGRGGRCRAGFGSWRGCGRDDGAGSSAVTAAIPAHGCNVEVARPSPRKTVGEAICFSRKVNFPLRPFRAVGNGGRRPALCVRLGRAGCGVRREPRAGAARGCAGLGVRAALGRKGQPEECRALPVQCLTWCGSELP